MTALKKHIAYTFLVLLVVSVATGIMGATGFILIPQAGLLGIFAIAISQCALGITALIKAPNYFDDPPAVAQARAEHAKDIEQTTGLALQLHDAQAHKIAEQDALIAELRQQIDQVSIDHLNEKGKWIQMMNEKEDHAQRAN